MDYKILLRGGEEVLLSEEQYGSFYENYKEAKTSSTLIPIPPDRLVAKSKIEEVVPAGEVKTDTVVDTLRYWYGTFKNGDGVKHSVYNWLDMREDSCEINAINELVCVKRLRGAIMSMLDRYDEFPERLRDNLKKPSLIADNLSELLDHLSAILKKPVISKEQLKNKMVI